MKLPELGYSAHQRELAEVIDRLESLDTSWSIHGSEEAESISHPDMSGYFYQQEMIRTALSLLRRVGSYEKWVEATIQARVDEDAADAHQGIAG